jgi:hypothetical protein
MLGGQQQLASALAPEDLTRLIQAIMAANRRPFVPQAIRGQQSPGLQGGQLLGNPTRRPGIGLPPPVR